MRFLRKNSYHQRFKNSILIFYYDGALDSRTMYITPFSHSELSLDENDQLSLELKKKRTEAKDKRNEK